MLEAVQLRRGCQHLNVLIRCASCLDDSSVFTYLPAGVGNLTTGLADYPKSISEYSKQAVTVSKRANAKGYQHTIQTNDFSHFGSVMRMRAMMDMRDSPRYERTVERYFGVAEIRVGCCFGVEWGVNGRVLDLLWKYLSWVGKARLGTLKVDSRATKRTSAVASPSDP